MQRIKFAAAAAVLVAMYGEAVAAEYPSRPLRVVVPFAPGGASDFVGRIIQPAYSSRLGQQVVIDNRSGAAGNLGVEVAARANADGYTLLLGNVGTMAINPVYYTKFPYKPLKDLVPISQLVDVPGSLVVHPSLPVKTAKDLAAHLKANPNKLNYGAAAPSSAVRRFNVDEFMRFPWQQVGSGTGRAARQRSASTSRATRSTPVSRPAMRRRRAALARNPATAAAAAPSLRPTPG